RPEELAALLGRLADLLRPRGGLGVFPAARQGARPAETIPRAGLVVRQRQCALPGGQRLLIAPQPRQGGALQPEVVPGVLPERGVLRRLLSDGVEPLRGAGTACEGFLRLAEVEQVLGQAVMTGAGLERERDVIGVLPGQFVAQAHPLPVAPRGLVL